MFGCSEDKEEAVTLMRNQTLWNRAVMVEQVELESIRKVVERWPS